MFLQCSNCFVVECNCFKIGQVNDPSALSINHPRRTTIIDVLKELRATTFLQLIQQTQLGSALQGSGPYTVFAPTDDAIDRLPKWAQRKLLADSETLAQMLVYHITVDKITSKDMKNELRIPTLLHGKPVTIRLYADRVRWAHAERCTITITAWFDFL